MAKPMTVGLVQSNCEEDRTMRAVLIGMLREAERSGPSLGTTVSQRRTATCPVFTDRLWNDTQTAA